MDKLKKDIECKKMKFKDSLDTIKNIMSSDNLTRVEIAAIITFLHNAYHTIESIIEKLLNYKKISISPSSSWHMDLLNLSLKNKIISHEISDNLTEYLGYFHNFKQNYLLDVNKAKIIPLARDLPIIWNKFLLELNTFLANYD